MALVKEIVILVLLYLQAPCWRNMCQRYGFFICQFLMINMCVDSVVQERLSDVFKVGNFFYLFINDVNVSSIVLFTYLLYCWENCIINSVTFDNWLCINIDDKRRHKRWQKTDQKGIRVNFAL